MITIFNQDSLSKCQDFLKIRKRNKLKYHDCPVTEGLLLYLNLKGQGFKVQQRKKNQK